jgi:hypothetical protein
LMISMRNLRRPSYGVDIDAELVRQRALDNNDHAAHLAPTPELLFRRWSWVRVPANAFPQITL